MAPFYPGMVSSRTVMLAGVQVTRWRRRLLISLNKQKAAAFHPNEWLYLVLLLQQGFGGPMLCLCFHGLVVSGLHQCQIHCQKYTCVMQYIPPFKHIVF